MTKKIQKWFRKYRLHMLVWALFIIYECVIVYLMYGPYGKPPTYILHYIIIICLFYINSELALPWGLGNKRTAIWKLPFAILLEIAIYLLLVFRTDLLLVKWHVITRTIHFTYDYASGNLYRCVYFISFSSGYYFLVTYNKERRKTEELERQQLNEIISRQKAEQELIKAQNAFLKAQINPHFLFNTLDFIYHNIMSVSPVAADAVITLAEMMRFAIDSDKMGEFIYLGDEVDQVINLRHLNFLRKNEELPFTLIYNDDIRDINFIPLVLLTLTENIFKHGNLDSEHEAILKIHIANELLIIESDNLSSRMRQHNSNRTGLINIEKRLRYAYGDAVYFTHSLDNDDHFRVLIKVPVQLLQHTLSSLSTLADTGKVLTHEQADLSKKHG